MHTGNILVDGSNYSNTWSAIVLVSMIIFVASYAAGLGNVPWQQGELFGLEGEHYYSSLLRKRDVLITIRLVRGIGTSIATAMNWSANLLINSTYLSLMSAITPSGAFGFYAGLCLLGWVFCLICFPETAGLSLEEVKAVFKDGFGIKESQRLRKEKERVKMEKEQGGFVGTLEKDNTLAWWFLDEIHDLITWWRACGHAHNVLL